MSAGEPLGDAGLSCSSNGGPHADESAAGRVRPTAWREEQATAAQLRAMVAGLNAIVWERDPHTLRVRFINDRAEQVLGYPTALWRTDEDLSLRMLHPDDREAALARMRRALVEDTDFSLSYRVRAADGRWLWLQHLGHVARDETGRATALHAVLLDVTAQRRREQASELLAAAGRTLTADGSVSERLDAVIGCALGTLGERGVVWLAGDDDHYRMVAAAPAELAVQVRGLPGVRAPEQLRPLIAAGQPFTADPFTERMRREALEGEPALERLAAADPQPRRQLIVPLQHGGERVGLLTFFTSDLDRSFDAVDLALAADLGQRIAAMVAAERDATRRQQLHQLTAVLSAAGTVTEAAAGLAEGLRGSLGASVVSVCTLGPDGLLHTLEARGHPKERQAGYAAMRLSAAFPIPEAARTGRPVWLRDRADLLARYPGIDQHLRAATQASAALPLRAADRIVGALGLAFTTQRRFEASERAFLTAVADQVAVALERTTLADVRREMAETLQRSLLPARVPHLAGLDVVTRYLPAVRGTAAGGDWYDLHRLSGGRVAVAVGDIVGDGAAAAAVMGQLRSSLGALLRAEHPPAEALTLLDMIAEDVPGAAVSTAACLSLDVATGAVAYSCAGHLPPLLVDACGARYLDEARGPALGLRGGGSRPERPAKLAEGATLLLYTDGLVERRAHDLDEGLERLAAAATARQASPVDTLVDGLLADLVDVGGATDDIAVVAVRRRVAGR